MLKTQEHIDLVAMFEGDYKIAGSRAEKENKDMWPKGYIYKHSDTNNLFCAYRRGYAFAKSIAIGQQRNLLDACKSMLEYIENGDILDNSTANEILDAARAAIG